MHGEQRYEWCGFSYKRDRLSWFSDCLEVLENMDYAVVTLVRPEDWVSATRRCIVLGSNGLK